MTGYDNFEEPPVIVFPNPTTAIDENGVRHTVRHKKDYNLPKDSGMAWHPAMGRYVKASELNDEFECLAADYYAKFKKPW